MIRVPRIDCRFATFCTSTWGRSPYNPSRPYDLSLKTSNRHMLRCVTDLHGYGYDHRTPAGIYFHQSRHNRRHREDVECGLQLLIRGRDYSVAKKVKPPIRTWK